MKLSAPIAFARRCDASGGIAVGAEQWVGANDEDNILRLYSTAGGAPEDDRLLVLDEFLEIEGEPDQREADLESATAFGDLVFWIGSHSQSRKGRDRLNRHRIFATKTVLAGGVATRIEGYGKPCKTLRSALVKEPRLKKYSLEEAILLPPKDPGGFNIESLCADLACQRLWLGLRNPIPTGGALLVPLENPRKLVEDASAPLFADPLLLDLGGLGFRDMIMTAEGYLILAGDFRDRNTAGAQPSALFTWSGPGGTLRRLDLDFGDLNPEALIAFPGGRVLLVSDDGARLTGGQKCKDVAEEQRSFRAVWLEHWKSP